MKRGSRDPKLKTLSKVVRHNSPFATATVVVPFIEMAMKVSSVLVGGMTDMLRSVLGGAVLIKMNCFL
jgi:hypothetical protein